MKPLARLSCMSTDLSYAGTDAAAREANVASPGSCSVCGPLNDL